MGICCNEMTIYTSRVYFIRWKKRPYPEGGGHQNSQERRCRPTLVCRALDISHKILSAVRITWYNCPRTGRVETHVVWTHILRFWNAQDGRALQILLSLLKTRVYKYYPLLSSGHEYRCSCIWPGNAFDLHSMFQQPPLMPPPMVTIHSHSQYSQWSGDRWSAQHHADPDWLDANKARWDNTDRV